MSLEKLREEMRAGFNRLEDRITRMEDRCKRLMEQRDTEGGSDGDR